MVNKIKKTLDIKVFGNNIKINTDEDEKYVYQLVSYLNSKMDEISQNVKIASNTERTILVALSIADDYFKQKKDVSSLQELDDNYANIINLIDNALSS